MDDDAVRKKDDAVTLRDFLQKKHFKVSMYHGSLPVFVFAFLHSQNREKEKALQDWISDKTPIMIATIAFGMGINKVLLTALDNQERCAFSGSLEYPSISLQLLPGKWSCGSRRASRGKCRLLQS